LVGSGNPEEGELRPQLLDRFGMHAQIRTVKEPELRVKIVEQRALFDKNPYEFRDSYKETQKELTERIMKAKNKINEIKISYEQQLKISQICSELNVDGLRGDMVINRAAKAFVAFEGGNEVKPKDIFTVITLCLRHRLRKDPLESMDSGFQVQEKFKRIFGYE
jgi:magnesium chelatase subunit I